VAARRRLDAELVRAGLATSRAHAHELIASSRVLVNGAVAGKPAHLVAASDNVTVAGPAPRFVGRGGDKLDAALDQFAVDVTGRRVLDCGASTGGFTDCLLQRGAREVVALDVGHGHLHPRIRNDERVIVLERTNIRATTTDLIGGAVDAAVADVSFISLTLVIPVLAVLCKSGAPMVLLVKPQFEAGRAAVSRGRGVVTDPAVYDDVRSRIEGALAGTGCVVRGWTDSPIRGAEGNREFFVHATAPA
jgi:23S rRNA (cytidine1920-2'-O)/16S rRNA (cytidine1409-2'-O)-methyltransferase